MFLPEWAPNLHPLIVHFPVALLMAAFVVDLCALVLPRAPWADATSAFLYPAGALSALGAYLTGRQAAATVLMPGMAHATLNAHWNWALATTLYFALVALVRVALMTLPVRPTLWSRAALTAASILGVVLLFYTAEQGGRLVYEHGVGVR